MKCPRCLNEDVRLFASGSKGMYCRACVGFKRQLLMEELEPVEKEILMKDVYLQLPFKLTNQQIEIGNRLSESTKNHNVLLYAVCGAGKTEMMLQCIKRCLKENKKIALAIPRRQVVLELQERLSVYFPLNKVIAICQGYTNDLEGDLIICTTHQLYRFHKKFDLLILDEPDAFPYKGNKVLQGIAKTSCKGTIVYSTATPDKDLESQVVNKELIELSLYQRPHGYPLIVPKCVVLPKSLCFLRLLSILRNKEKSFRQVMIFCATIKQAKRIYRMLALVYKVGLCTSKTINKDEVIESFRQKNFQHIVCTTILERGVTFKSVDVVVFNCDHIVFDEASLVQIAGRVGRKAEDPYGECIFLATSQNENVNACVKRIQDANQIVFDV